MSGKPTSDQLAPAIQPTLRLYIDAKIDEELRPIREALKKLGDAIELMGAGSLKAAETLAARIESLEQRYTEDDKFVFDKARLVRFLQRMDKE